MVRFVHTADWQIGMRGGGLGAAGELVARERIRAVDRLLAEAQTRSASFVVACGDLFEHNQVAQELVEEVARVIAAHRGVTVHAIPGNHDLAGPGSVWNRSALRAVPNLHVHTDTGPVVLADATLHPFPVRARGAVSDPLAELPDLATEPGVQVALAHGHLTSITFGAHEDDIRLPLGPGHVDRATLDYLALGHWHGMRLVPGRDGATRIGYSGTPEQTSFRETSAGNALLVEIEKKGAPPAIEAFRVGAFHWATLSFAFAGDTDVERLRGSVRSCGADFLELEVSGEAPAALYPAFRDLVAEAEAERKHVALREKVRWNAETPITLEPIADAALAEVDRRLAAALAGADAEVVRAAREMFRRYVREVER
jgi:DNA repair exonuclease SbcCD nuclease subunit